MAGKPDAIIVGAVYQPGAEFIKLTRKEGVKAHLASGSFAGGNNLVNAADSAAGRCRSPGSAGRRSRKT